MSNTPTIDRNGVDFEFFISSTDLGVGGLGLTAPEPRMARRCDPWQFARLGDVSFDIDARDEEIIPVYFHPSHAYLPEEWYGQRLEVEATKKAGFWSAEGLVGI